MKLDCFLVLSVLAVSCTGQTASLENVCWKDIRFSIDDSAATPTRSTSLNVENSISDIQIAVYSPSGQFCTGGEISGGTLTLSVPVEMAGYSVAALVNAGASLSSCKTLEKISDLQSSLSGNKPAAGSILEMFGVAGKQTFHSGTTCVVPVSRIPAKVEIDKIVNQIPSKPDFTIKSIYLINVNTSSNVAGGVSSAVWKQQRKLQPLETDVLEYTCDKIEKKLDFGGSYDTPHYFYCYANPTTADTSSPTWSPRYTRLVVEADYNGTTCYYPISIVGSGKTLDSGNEYVITQLTITGPGSDDPDVPISKMDASFSVTINDWGKGFSQTINY